MKPAAVALAILLATSMITSGCLVGGKKEDERDTSPYPPGWDEEAPEASRLATVPHYQLTQSSTFLIKGQEYGRYVVHVPERLDDVAVFFSTSNRYSTGKVPGPEGDEHHFQFMQIRPLGHEVRVANVDAATQFAHGGHEATFTLTYIYGNGANHPFLAPYEGSPDHWSFEPGYYEFVIASDEKMTVGINVKTDGDYWVTHYHPQEMGQARGEALHYQQYLRESVGGQIPELNEGVSDLVLADEGEILNYFTFADAWYSARTFALDAAGVASVSIDGQVTPHRFNLESPGPGSDEAYAYAMHFNGQGPLSVPVEAKVEFEEIASAQSTLFVMLMIFGVTLTPVQTFAGA